MTDKIETKASDDTPTPSKRMDRLKAKIDDVIDRLPEPAPTQGDTAILHRAIDWLSGMWLTRLLSVLGIWLLIVTVVVLIADISERQAERADRQAEAEFRKLAQVATAWELLLTQVGGNIGKGNALSILVSGNNQLSGVDLSCRARGVFDGETCKSSPTYANVVFGNGNFWEDDHERLQGGPFGGIKQYVVDVDFSGSEIVNLKAESLQIDEGFDDVTGHNWVVRNARMTDGKNGREQGPRNFTCVNCVFSDSTLTWSLMQDFSGVRLVNSTVLLDHLDVDPTGVWQIETFLDAPALFVLHDWARDKNDFYNGRREAITWSDYVAMDIYKTAEFCVNEADYKTLRPHLQMRDADKIARFNATKKRLRDANIVEPILVEEPMGNKSSADFDVTRTYREPHQSQNSYVIRTAQYACGFPYDDVEPLLNKKLEVILQPNLLRRR